MKLAFCLGFRNWHMTHLLHCLASIRSHTTMDPISFCDLGSHDFRRIQKAVVPYNVIYSFDPQSEWSRSRALNIAARTVSMPWDAWNFDAYVFTDADMIFPSLWFNVVRTLPVDAQRIWLTRSRNLDEGTTRRLYFNGKQKAEIDQWLFDHSVPHNNDLGMGAAMVVPRAWFDRVGGFDEFYSVWGCEDNDLVVRAIWDNLEYDWLPEAWVAHQYHPRDWPTKEQFDQVTRNRAYLRDRMKEQGPIVRNQS